MSQDASRDANVNIKADVSDYRTGVQGATQDTNTLAHAVDTLATKLDGLQRRVGKKMTLFAAADLAMLGSMVAMSANYEKQLSTLSAQAAITGRSVSGVSTELRQLTREMGVSRGEITATATAISKMGLSAQSQIGGMTEVFLKTGKAAGESATSIANAMITLGRQMGTLDGGATQMQKFTDSLLKVSATAGVSAQSVAEFSNSIAPIARVAGMNEKAVLGLSAAFVQAGNDGYVAANTFNSMLSDIVRQTQSGGPGLAKYASIVGVTVDQFKRLGSTKGVLEVFNAIAKGGPQSIQILDRMGIDGARAAKAMQTMAAQAGGIEKLVQTAMGGYGDGSTDTGYGATKGLTDAFEELRNITQDIGTSIGQFWLTPLTKSLDVVNTMLGQAAKLTGVFSAGGAMAGVGGLAMGGAGIMAQLGSFLAPVAALNWLRNSRARGAFGEAFGSARAGGAPSGEYFNRYQAGTQGRLESLGYRLGSNLGFLSPSGGGVSGMRDRALGMVPRLWTVGVNDMARFYRESPVEGWARGSSSISLGAALKGAVMSTDGFTRSMFAATKATGAFVAAQATGGVRGLAQMGGGLLRSAGGAALNFLGGPIGMGLAGAMGVSYLLNANDERKQRIAGMTMADYNQNTPYTSALGQATTNIANLASAAFQASSEVTSLSQAARAAKTDMGNKTTNPNTSGINTAEQGAAYLRTLNTNDPNVIKSAMQDVRRALPFGEGNKAIDLYMNGGKFGIDDISNAMGSGIDQSASSGFWSFFGRDASDDAQARTKLGLGAVGQYTANASLYGDKAANQAKVAGLYALLDKVFSNPDDRSPTAAANRTEAIAQIEKQYGFNFNYTAASMMQRKGEYRSAAEFLAAQGSDSDFGKYRQSWEGQGVVFGSAKAAAGNLPKLMVSSEDPTVKGLKGKGFDITSGVLNQALTSGDSSTLANAALQLYAKAKAQAKGDVNKIPSILQGILAEEGASTPDAKYGALYNLAKQAQGLAGVDQQFADVYQGRVGRLRGAQTRYQSVMNEAPTTETVQRQIEAKQAYEGQKASYYQYLQNMVKAQEDFARSMKRSDEDYYRQRGYAQEDFQTQSRHSYEDYHKSVKRMQEDAAKTIYNPFQRVYSTYTADVGTIKQNLADQTRRIKQQVANLRRLKKLGLSQQVIDMLDLANPANAQQVEELAQEMTKNDINQFNALAKSRQSATSSLVTSDLNQSYTRSAKDFQTAMSRGIEEFNKGMARMAAARKTQQARAKEDLDLMSKEYVGDFTTMFNKAQTLVKNNLGKTGQITMNELNTIKAAFPEFFTSMDATSNSSGTQGEHSGYRNAPASVSTRTTNNRTVNSRTVSTTNYNITGATIAVQTNDPEKMAAKIAAISRANKLRGSTI